MEKAYPKRYGINDAAVGKRPAIMQVKTGVQYIPTIKDTANAASITSRQVGFTLTAGA